MRKFVLKVLLFFALIVIFDIISGWGFNYLKSHAKGGDTQKNYYINELCSDDIIVLGSSRAVRHYDPQIIEDSLGLSCYNCGEPGCGIITAYARYSMIRSRHIPKLIIYEVTPSFDYLMPNDYTKDLGKVRQYSDNPVVKKMFLDLCDPLQGLRLLSSMYRNNSYIFNNCSNYVRPWQYKKGYLPLNSSEHFNEFNNASDIQVLPIDSVKLSYIEQLIQIVHKDSVAILFIASPRYIDPDKMSRNTQEFEPIIELCNKYHVPFKNNTFLEGISENKSFFHDYGHLNEEGAKTYTTTVCHELNKAFQK